MKGKLFFGQIVAGAALVGTAHAALVDIDFQDHDTPANGSVDNEWESSAPDGIANITGLRNINHQWNTFNVNNGNSLALNDVDGNASGITATLNSFSGSGVAKNSQFANSPVDDVARDYVYNGGGAGVISITLSGLDATGATTYNLHVISAVLWGGWVNIDVTGNGATINQTIQDDKYEGGDLVDNYTTFSGVAADESGEILIQGYGWESNGDAVISGIQIETIPEPASLGLVGLVGAGTLFIRRKLMI